MYNTDYNPDDLQIITNSDLKINDTVYMINSKDAYFHVPKRKLTQNTPTLPSYVDSIFADKSLEFKTIPRDNSKIFKAYITKIEKYENDVDNKKNIDYFVKIDGSEDEFNTKGYYFMYEIIPYDTDV